MIFFSKEFLFIFIPILSVLSLFVIKFSKSSYLYKYLLIVFSLIFYGAWSIKFLFFFVILILCNYYYIDFFIRKINTEERKFYSLILIVLNLSILIYYKYTNFIINNLNFAFDLSYNLKNIILPLGISFIILQQIGFIWTATSFKKNIKLSNFLLFSMFFPQIIAGPILIYDDLKNQLSKKFFNVNYNNIWKGAQIFFIGMVKKVYIADKLNYWVISFENPNLLSLDHFVSILAYGLQVYFDFSAYSDMAVGLALIFGFTIPINFFSPFKSRSISEFWQRWHMTLTRFLENLIYFPTILNLGRYIKNKLNINNLLIVAFAISLTFFISGFWHGAGWNFIAFGLYHGFFVILHKFYSYYFVKNSNSKFKIFLNLNISKLLITNIIILLGWVLFRSSDFNSAINFYYSLFSFFDGSWASIFDKEYFVKIITLIILFIACFTLPNSFQLISYKFKDKKYSCSKKINKMLSKISNYYLDIIIIFGLILYWLRTTFSNQPFIYYQF